MTLVKVYACTFIMKFFQFPYFKGSFKSLRDDFEKNMNRKMFQELHLKALCTISQVMESKQFLSEDGWVNKMWYIQYGILFSCGKKAKNMHFPSYVQPMYVHSHINIHRHITTNGKRGHSFEKINRRCVGRFGMRKSKEIMRQSQSLR